MNSRMLRLLAGTAAAASIAGVASAAVVDGADVTNPFINTNVEVFAPTSTIFVSLPDSLAPNLADGVAINGFIRGVDAMGNAVTGNTSVVLASVSNGGDYDNAAGNTLQVDLGASGIPAAFFNTSGVTSFQLVFSTDPAPTTNAVQTAFDAANEANDENLDLDNTAPQLSNAFINNAGDTLFLVYSESLSNGSAPNTNDTALGSVTATDFQFNTTNSFDNTTGNPPVTFTVQGTFLDTNNTTIEVDISGNATVAAGTFIRSAADDDGNPVAANDIFDVVGNQAFQQDSMGNAVTTGVQIETIDELTIESVEFTTEIDNTFGAVTADAVRVIYNLPVDAADLGDVGANSFYGQFLQLAGGNSSIELVDSGTAGANDPNVDPDNPNAVLLSVQQTGGAQVLADGLAQTSSNNTYSIVTDTTNGNVPSSIFDTNDYTADQTLNVGDGIDPAAEFFSFHDLDSDGVLDAIAVVFNEPVTTTNTNTGFTINVVAGRDVQWPGLLEQDGDFPASADIPDSAAGTITPSALTVAGVRVDDTIADDVARLSMNNAVVLTFDPTAVDWVGEGAGVNPPGTNGPNNLLTLDHPEVVVTDNGGNELTVSANTGVAVDRDRAPALLARAAYYTGDNQTAGSNDQFVAEQDGTVGDQGVGDRLQLSFTEDTGATNIAGDDVSFGSGPEDDFNQAGDAQLGFSDAQSATFEKGTDNEDFAPGAMVTLSGLPATVVDSGGNAPLVVSALSNNGTIESVVAPYISEIDGGAVAAFLVDSDGNGFANQIIAQFTENPVAGSGTVSNDDFTLGQGTISSVSISGNTLTIDLDESMDPVSMTATVDVDYNGAVADAADPSRLLQDADGNTVADVDAGSNDFDAEQVSEPTTPVEAPAIMNITGSGVLADGSTPFPIGTQIYAAVAIPTADSLEAAHNGVEFRYERGDDYGTTASASLEAVTNHLLGLERFVYLQRSEDNTQIFVNQKDDGFSGSVDDDFEFVTDIIQVDFNFNNLANISFSGQGEDNSNRVQNGRLGLCWDVIRSGDGSYESFLADGYSISGQPVLNRAVVSNPNGTFTLNVAGPTVGFNGSARLDSILNPIIIVVELPSGERFAVSSLASSINGGPILFDPNNRRQDQDGSASSAFSLSLNLANVNQGEIFGGWNTVGFPSNSGWATAQNRIPVLPGGVAQANVVISDGLLAVGALDQFVYWGDDGDGMWTAADDNAGDLDTIVIDAQCIPHFAFTMTSAGVQFGSGIDNLVGGYAFGFFNAAGQDYGVNRFGAPLNATTLFPAGFPNSNTTLGWALVTNTFDYSADFTPFFTNNAFADYVIYFENVDGSEFATGSAGTGSGQDLDMLDEGTPIFVHFLDN